MEQTRKSKRQRKKSPRVPIKTYKWEDIRRARLRGGYPWTYLYKGPFNEELDPREFTMEAMRKSKSSSTLGGKSSPGVDIQEIQNDKEIQENLLSEPSSYIVITEVPSDSDINHSTNNPRGSLTIEEETPTDEPEVLNLESAESSDNISQYLDKEEQAHEIPAVQGSSKDLEDERKERAKSEEPKRKRKLSIESSYSRKSLSKLGIIKKLKEAKDKLKVPKLSLPNLSKDDSQKKTKNAEKQNVVKKEKKEKVLAPPKVEKPVYIHIPLKPPEGETDEFSYLEFGDKKPPAEEEKKSPPMEKDENDEKTEDKVNQEPIKEITEKTLPVVDESGQRRYSENPDEIVAFEILKAQSIDLEEASKNGLQIGNDGEILIIQDSNNKHKDDVIIFMPEKEDAVSTKSDTRSSQKNLSRQSSKKVRAKSAEPEGKRRLSIDSSYSRRSLSKLGIMKKLRDAKDKIKFPKLSLSRTGSKRDKKQETKKEENVEKKESETTKTTNKNGGSKRDKKQETKKEENVEKKESETTKTTNKNVESHKKTEPKYIHIPLKPPPGQTDEFSYLEFEEKKSKTPDKQEAKKEDQSSIESPASTQNDDVQFIFLTPPSDDEILDHPDIPETPSSDNKIFFASRIDELKELAKGVVDASANGKKKLEAVTEENGNDKNEESNAAANNAAQDKEITTNVEENKNLVPEPIQENVEKLVIDEEDGLKLTESAMAKEAQNIKSKEVPVESPQISNAGENAKEDKKSQDLKPSLKNEPTSPILKKKVSFKRRSRDDSKDGVYEDVVGSQAKKNESGGETKLGVLGNSQSMSVDEEKSYLDEKIIKSTSLEEDYNRWSKISDHEYEPVNPPPEVLSPTQSALPKVQVVDTDQGSQHKTLSLASSTTSLERRMLGGEPELHEPESFSVEEIQTQIEDRYFNKRPTTTSNIQTLEEPHNESLKENKAPKQEGPGRFQQALKAQTDKFKNKLHGIKKPNIKMPSKPKFEKPNFKFEKPKFNFPKIPDTAKINLTSFSLPRKQTKRSLKERQFSTESNAGDSKKKLFDFSTYPRIFKRKPKDELDSLSSNNEPEAVEFATVPRTKRNNKNDADRWGGRESIRISLHAEESLDEDTNGRDDVDERQTASHTRYAEDIDIDDAYEKENQEIHRASPFSQDYNSRWNHGSFHAEPNLEFAENFRNKQVTDLDSPEDGPQTHGSFDNNIIKDIHSSESSLGIHQRGVLEEIDSDEFFLRQKGISQDNIEVGMYLNSEIREALKSPNNALSDLQKDSYHDNRGSNQSLPEPQAKRKVIKKPKRKKTPHVSHEQISFDQDSETDFVEPPPARPKRRSKKQKNFVPYQETVNVDSAEGLNEDESILLRHLEVENKPFYENEKMEGKEQPAIKISDSYAPYNYSVRTNVEVEDEKKPSAPPRKHKSLKSLNFSEHDSILGDVEKEIPQNVEIYKSEHEYIIPSNGEPPQKPRRTLSRSSSKSGQVAEFEEPPVRPARTRSRSGTRSRADSVTSMPECVEEPCLQDFRDYMGYAVIDKNLKREPPLPPPKTSSKQKSSSQSMLPTTETRFFTVPRQKNEEPPARPVRNYSTLGPSRPPRRKPPPNMTDEEKQSVDLSQYIEIDDEPNRDLHSGEVIQKMRDRPLPAPPRPPRQKAKAAHDDNLQEDITQYQEETEVSTQTDPLADDFICEELKELTDSVVEPSEDKESGVRIKRHLKTPTQYSYEEETITHGSLVVEPLNGAKILPDSELSRERTIPIEHEYSDEFSEIPDDFKKLKDPYRPQTPQERKMQYSISEQQKQEFDVLKAQKLQVSDLDVDKLSVNELLANKIIVSEIDSGNIATNELSSKTGSLKVGEIELPPSVVQQLFEKLQSVAQESNVGPTETSVSETSDKKEDSDNIGQKKTSIENVIPETPSQTYLNTNEIPDDNVACVVEDTETLKDSIQTDSLNSNEKESATEVHIPMEPPEPPTRSDSTMRIKNVQTEVPEAQFQHIADESVAEPPQRPPRQADKAKSDDCGTNDGNKYFQDPEVDDEPPPRPPHPNVEYFPSQPPASFYALRAQHYVENVEDDIPTIPRRRRHHKPPISGSSSEDVSHPPPTRRRYRSPDPTIPQLTGQLIQACGSAANATIKRLITHVTNNVLRNADGQQDLHVMIIILLILIAGLILLGFGDGKTVHYHHWEYFNPPGDL